MKWLGFFIPVVFTLFLGYQMYTETMDVWAYREEPTTSYGRLIERVIDWRIGINNE